MDIRSFLEEHDIEYWTSGKNVAQGYINIECPFCSDSSNHLGISLKGLYVKCWRCGKHSLFDLIKQLIDCTSQEASDIIKSLSPGEGYENTPLSDTSSISTRAVLPPESTKDFPKIHTDYLKDRGFFNASTLIKKYRLQAVHTIGKYKFRIIIPVFMNKKLVSFTSRDITEIREPKYLSCSLNEGGNIKNTVYNYDSIQQNSDVILVEGVLDAWKLGLDAITFFGVTYTTKQIIALKNKNIRNLFVLFDSDSSGVKGAEKIAKVISPLVKKVEIITLTKVKDPGDLNLEEAELLRNQLINR